MHNQRSEILDRVPPHSLDAERALIGSVLLDRSRLDSVAWVKPGDFYSQANGIIWHAIHAMHDAGDPIDEGLLYSRIKRSGDAEAVGDRAYIVECAQSVGVAAHAVAYAKIVAQYAKTRRIVHAATVAIEDAYAPGSEPDAILESLEGTLSSIRTQADLRRPVTCREVALDATAQIDATMSSGRGVGLHTGLERVDENYGGLFPGELTILAARPGVGKTSLAMQIAAHNADRGRLVYFVSLEMLPVEQSIRLACSTACVSNHDVRRGKLTRDDTAALVEAFNAQRDELIFHPTGDVTMQGIRREVRQLVASGLRLVVIDYLQLITPGDRRVNREEQVAQISRELKRIPRDYGVAVLCLCQLNRQVVDEFKEPTLAQLRESGAIEQNADAVWFIWKNKETENEPWNSWIGVAKNRNGETGRTPLTWIPRRTRFECYESAGHSEFDAWKV